MYVCMSFEFTVTLINCCTFPGKVEVIQAKMLEKDEELCRTAPVMTKENLGQRDPEVGQDLLVDLGQDQEVGQGQDLDQVVGHDPGQEVQGQGHDPGQEADLDLGQEVQGQGLDLVVDQDQEVGPDLGLGQRVFHRLGQEVHLQLGQEVGHQQDQEVGHQPGQEVGHLDPGAYHLQDPEVVLLGVEVVVLGVHHGVKIVTSIYRQLFCMELKLLKDICKNNSELIVILFLLLYTFMNHVKL